MQVTLLLFAVYRDLAGTAGLTLDLDEGATAGVAVAALRARDARFAALPQRPVVAVNREVTALDRPLRHGDEVALLPPVAGG